ncbi:MAG TPA: VOC family protein [Candidatus Saccharimonadales bacterium]|jgi:catechol 2,3-dioxygenase-like lactoylglutathione lyase family enzyme|nr:VOC family protein [Candidatus Saccharimonadales bacterium]
MLDGTKAFSGFAVKDLDAAEKFYKETLGLDAENGPMGLQIKIGGGNPIFVYAKPDHTPATFTIMNFPVDDIDEAVNELKKKGVVFEKYEGDIQTDENDIARGRAAGRGPDIAWFKDPSGNILSVLQDA